MSGVFGWLRRWFRRWLFLWPFVLGPLTVFVSGILVNELTAMLDRCIKGRPDESPWPPRGEWVTVVVLLILFGLLLCAWHQFSKEITWSRTRHYDRRPSTKDPRSHLVLLLSHLTDQNSTADGWPRELALTEDLKADLDALLAKQEGPNWPWEQMLRALWPHREVLQAVYCLCSRQSLPQATKFRAILQRYGLLAGRSFWIVLPDREVSEYPAGPAPVPAGLDFENYDQLTEVLGRLIRKLKAQGVPERSIMVDLTGGQKVTSVAAMATTFDLEISAQYVQTGGKKEAYSYDVILGRPRLDLPVK